jgi:2-dehydropantoate 2-reductase
VKNISIALIGVGAIGGAVAAKIKQAGYNIEVVAKYLDYISLIQEKGISLTGVLGESTVKIPAVAKVEDLSSQMDIIFLATKALDMDALLVGCKAKLKENGVLITLQNGITQPAISKIIEPQKIISCVIGWGSTMLKRGMIEITSKGEFVIGCLQNPNHLKLPFIKKILENIYPTFISQNMIGGLYSKLIINSCITSLGALCGLYLGQMLKMRYVRDIFIEIMYEMMKVAKVMGIQVEPYAGKIDYYTFLKRSKWASFKRHTLIRLIGLKYRRITSSSLQSLERGRKTEIDIMNGYVVENAKKYNIDVPINSIVVQIIKEIEQGKRKIAVDNFQDILRVMER